MTYPMWNEAKTGILVARESGGLAFLEEGAEFEALQNVAVDWHEIPSRLPTEDEVRARRNALLSASDWTQVADAPVDQAAWAAYRQSLRDVPNQPGFPRDVEWPTKP